MVIKLWCLQGLAIASIWFLSLPVRAQIIPDATLRVNSVVTKDGNTLTIDGGSRAAGNLFHSFTEFSLPTGEEASFNNAIDVQNIFSRVTGSNISHIDGLIRANGTANLFLLNPNGIIFGPNAKLNIGGSFLATTANAIGWANGNIFSANTDNQTPTQLLSVNPNVLLFNQMNPGDIANRSVDAGTGLQVAPGRSLSLVGGEVLLEGGKLRTAGGRIELAAIASTATVGLNIDGTNVSLNVPGDIKLDNISLSNGAIANVSGTPGGTIAVNAQNLTLTGQSRLTGGISEVGSPQSRAGNIEINVPGTININGSGILNSVAASGVGNAGNINITTDSLFVTNGGFLSAVTRGKGNSGNVNIQAANAVSFEGVDANSNRSLASVAAIAGSVGNAGNINITTGSLSLTNGGFLSSGTLGQGNAGNININANTVSFEGLIANGNPTSAFTGADQPGVGNGGNFNITTGSLSIANRAYVSAATLTRGNAGNVNINTNELSITNGGFVSAATLGKGNGGSVNVNANTISLDGVGSNGSPSFITTAVNRSAVGDGGDINITTGSLSITNGARITNVTVAPGNGGNIAINTNNLCRNMLNGTMRDRIHNPLPLTCESENYTR